MQTMALNPHRRPQSALRSQRSQYFRAIRMGPKIEVCKRRTKNIFLLFAKQFFSRSLQNGKVECVQMRSFKSLDAVLRHCTSPRVTKVWYFSVEFLEIVLEKLNACNVRLHSLDVYPYAHYVGMSRVYEHLPHLKTVAMRSHGNDYFFTGLE